MSLPRILFLTSFLFLTACGRLGFAGPEPTATSTVVAVPTFTPTTVTAATEAQAAVAAPDPAGAAGTVETTLTPDGAKEASETAALLPTPTPESVDAIPASGEASQTAESTPAKIESSLTVIGEFVNVRQGPGTGYAIVGSAVAGDTYTVTGRNEAADWWQACCFPAENAEPGWLYGPLVEVVRGDVVAVAADIPPAPTAAPVVEEPVAEEPTAGEATEEEAAPPDPVDQAHSGTAGVFDPNAQYHVVGYRVIGYGENNGGIFNNGGQHMIFINVIDAAGNGIDGAVVKNAIDDNVNIVTGPKGPGRAEFEMFWDPYKLYVASDPSGPVTSQITNQMNTAYPHIPDIIGRLGPPEEEYAICPTPDDRCEPPFYHAHWSYEVTFQKVN